MTNTYGDGNGNLSKVKYGNNTEITYEYDKYDRLTAEKEGTEYIARYHYDADGNLARVEDVKNNKVTEYSYDISGRLSTWQDPLGTLFFGYDNQDRNSRTTVESGGQKFTTSYAYLDGNRPGTTTYAQGKTERAYDSLQRESVHKVYPGSSGTHLRTETVYYDFPGTSRTTNLPVQYNNSAVSSSGAQTALAGYTSFAYEYDDNGNITAVTEKKGNETKRTTYQYDALGQLVRENNARTNKTYKYTYDSGGNLTKREEYAYTTAVNPGTATKTVNYTYGDSGWKDLLTAYNGQTITYDGIGNPLSYRDGMTFTWEEGRQLKKAVLFGGAQVTYEYDTNGNRTAKTAGSKKTEYLTDGTNIYVMEQGNEKLVFLYDATGRREGFLWYTGTQNHGAYSYVYNLQGDVVGIVDEGMNLVVSYEYDSWGRLLNQEPAEGTVGNLNPFRYRGYCYDVETGFYYVSSRYYDPEVGRFLNADSVIDNRGVITQNLFAYCGNNPVNNADPTGHAFGAIIGGLVGGILGGLTAAASGKSIAAGIGTGALTGAIIGGICDGSAAVVAAAAGTVAKGVAIVKTMVACATVAAGGNVLNQVINYHKESKQYNTNNPKQRNINKSKNSVSNKKETECVSLKNYIDMESVKNSAISAAICAPLAVGGGIVVDGVLGTGVSGLTKLSKIIAESAMGSNVSMIQTSLEYIIPIFED